MRADRRSDGRLLDTLPWTLAALGLAVIPHIPALPVWVVLPAFACGLWRWIVELRRWPLPWRGFRIALAFGGFLAVLFAYGGINGVGPGTALLVLMASLKLLETRTRRDQFVLLFIAFFLVLATLLREQFLWTLPYLFAAVFVIIAAWLNAGRSGKALAPHVASRGAGRLLLHALPLMLVFWVLFPRVPGPFWAIPNEQNSAVTGLSDRMSPGDISNLSQSDARAFRVWFDGEVPRPAERYWRGIVMEQVLNGRTWSAAQVVRDPGAASRVEPAGEALSYRVRLDATSQRYLFLLERPYDVDAEGAFLTRRHEVGRFKAIDRQLVYTATSLPDATLEPTLSEGYRNWLTRLPDGTNPRTRGFAAQLRERATSDRDYVQRVLAWYREEPFFYTLSPPALGRDAADEFLFSTRRGFCEHYATSFATLMRAVGIPARVVAGYQGGELNPLDTAEPYYLVRQSDAHAWAEVWFEGDGWVRVDPTAAVAPQRIESGLYGALDAAEFGVTGRIWRADFVETLRFYWDLTNARWDEWVLGYGPATQEDFLRWLGMERPDWRRMVVWLVAVMALLLAGLTGWLAWRHRRPGPDRAERLYRRFVRATGIPRAPGEPPLGYAERASAMLPGLAGDIRRVTALYLDTRYAGRPRTDELAAAVRPHWSPLRGVWADVRARAGRRR